MASLLRVALVAAYLAAAALPCGSADRLEPEPARGHAAALHVHGGAADAPAGALRAPCPCGCDETPAGRRVASPLGAALAPSAVALRLPRTAPPDAPRLRFVTEPEQRSDPVPRPA